MLRVSKLSSLVWISAMRCSETSETIFAICGLIILYWAAAGIAANTHIQHGKADLSMAIGPCRLTKIRLPRYNCDSRCVLHPLTNKPFLKLEFHRQLQLPRRTKIARRGTRP